MAMRAHWTPFEIVTGAGAAFLAIAFACISLETGRIETGVAARAVAVLGDTDLYWFAVQPQGRGLVVTGAAPEVATVVEAEERLAAMSGAASIEQRIRVVGSAGACQSELDALQSDRPVTFRRGLEDPAPASEAVLAAAAGVISRCGVQVEVAVHGDGGGSAALGLALSQRRADQVARRLAAHGVRGDRIVATGYGSSQPVAASLDELRGSAADAAAGADLPGRPPGRRLEFRILGAAT